MWLCLCVCVRVVVSLWLCPCGCVRVVVSVWLCPCACVRVLVSVCLCVCIISFIEHHVEYHIASLIYLYMLLSCNKVMVLLYFKYFVTCYMQCYDLNAQFRLLSESNVLIPISKVFKHSSFMRKKHF